jgi:hypothetical protein
MTGLAQSLEIFSLCEQPLNERIPIYKPNLGINYRDNVIYLHILVCKLFGTSGT